MPGERELRAGLLGAEPMSAERRERFAAEMGEILEPRLSRGYRWYYGLFLASILMGLPGAVCGMVFDGEQRWRWVLMAAGELVCAWWVWHILRRGAEPLRSMQGMSKVLAGLSTAAAVVVILYGLRQPSMESILWGLLGVVACVFFNVINLWNRTLVAERSVRVQMLRVEYRLAEAAAAAGQGERGHLER
jgi:hypothetical protein